MTKLVVAVAFACVALLVPTVAHAETFDGGPESNVFHGLPGADTLRGRGGDDFLYGMAGRDNVDGGTGADFVDGGPGDDRLYGGTDTKFDEIYGRGGDDKLFGRGGDLLSAGAGNDVVTIAYAWDGQNVYCGKGIDKVIFNEPYRGKGIVFHSCERAVVVSAG